MSWRYDGSDAIIANIFHTLKIYLIIIHEVYKSINLYRIKFFYCS